MEDSYGDCRLIPEAITPQNFCVLNKDTGEIVAVVVEKGILMYRKTKVFNGNLLLSEEDINGDGKLDAVLRRTVVFYNNCVVEQIYRLEAEDGGGCQLHKMYQLDLKGPFTKYSTDRIDLGPKTTAGNR